MNPTRAEDSLPCSLLAMLLISRFARGTQACDAMTGATATLICVKQFINDPVACRLLIIPT